MTQLTISPTAQKIHNLNACREELKKQKQKSIHFVLNFSYVFKKIIQFPYRFLRISSPSHTWMYTRSIFSIIMPFMCCELCVFAFLRALFMHNERWICEVGGGKKEHNYCFLVAIYGIFHSHSQTNSAVSCFSDERISFLLFPWLIFAIIFLLFCIASTAAKRMKKKS